MSDHPACHWVNRPGPRPTRPRNPCYTCSKPTLRIEFYRPSQTFGQLYKCPHNTYAPGVCSCPHYERAPGTDDFLGDPEW